MPLVCIRNVLLLWWRPPGHCRRVLLQLDVFVVGLELAKLEADAFQWMHAADHERFGSAEWVYYVEHHRTWQWQP